MLDRVLDKGIVIDAWVRVSLVGIDLITVEARVVVASIDTYLKYSDAVGAAAIAARPTIGSHGSARFAPQTTMTTTMAMGARDPQAPRRRFAWRSNHGVVHRAPRNARIALELTSVSGRPLLAIERCRMNYGRAASLAVLLDYNEASGVLLQSRARGGDMATERSSGRDLTPFQRRSLRIWASIARSGHGRPERHP